MTFQWLREFNCGHLHEHGWSYFLEHGHQPVLYHWRKWLFPSLEIINLPVAAQEVWDLRSLFPIQDGSWQVPSCATNLQVVFEFLSTTAKAGRWHCAALLPTLWSSLVSGFLLWILALRRRAALLFHCLPARLFCVNTSPQGWTNQAGAKPSKTMRKPICPTSCCTAQTCEDNEEGEQLTPSEVNLWRNAWAQSHVSSGVILEAVLGVLVPSTHDGWVAQEQSSRFKMLAFAFALWNTAHFSYLDSFLSLRMSPAILEVQLRALISQRFAWDPS